jgi:hypothetical protein
MCFPVRKQSKKNWENLLKATLGPQYIMLRGHALQATHAAVFVHAGILPLISAVRSCAVATGLGTKSAKLGNKGGIGIAFEVSCTVEYSVQRASDGAADTGSANGTRK